MSRRRGRRLIIRDVGVGERRLKLGLPGSRLTTGYFRWKYGMGPQNVGVAARQRSTARHNAAQRAFLAGGPGEGDGLRGPHDVCGWGFAPHREGVAETWS